MLALRRRYEWVFPAFWIGRIGAFALDRGSGNTPDMEPRIDAFADLIAAQVEKAEDDEVLVVGHSAGSHMGVSVVARALRKMKPASRGFSFLMLGHAVPLIGVQPQAEAFRAELFEIAADPRLFWVDISAPGDGLSFPLVDPVTACGGKQPDPRHPSPLLLSPRFHTLFSPDAYRRLRRSFYRLHFQYLMASELPGEYDYYLITAGPLSLIDRFAHVRGTDDRSGPESSTE